MVIIEEHPRVKLETILKEVDASETTKEALRYFMSTKPIAEGLITYVRLFPEDISRNQLADIVELLIPKIWGD